MSQTTYIYSLSANFSNGILPGQLAIEIGIAIPTPILDGIGVSGDVVSITFESAIPNQSILDTLVANHVPIYNQDSLGDTQIGASTQPSQLAIGEGQYITEGLLVVSNSNLAIGTWVNNTPSALSTTGIPFNLFQATSTGNCMYLGSDSSIFGFEINISTATSSITPSTSVIWEFWNGTAWTAFNIMQMYPSPPQHSYSNSFISLQNKFQIRFGLTMASPFAILTLNNAIKYWVRLRIINALSSLPAGDLVTMHTNSTIINTDGTIEYYGNARIFKDFEVLVSPSGMVTSSQEFFFAPNFSVTKTNDVFSHGSLVRVGFNFKMPIEIDTSFPIKLNIGFVCNNTGSGNVFWTIRYVYSAANSNIYLTSTDSQNHPNPNILTTTMTSPISANQNNQDLRSTISLNVSTFPTSLSSADKYIFYGVLERNSMSSNMSDTYPGSVFLTDVHVLYSAWCNFGKIANF